MQNSNESSRRSTQLPNAHELLLEIGRRVANAQQPSGQAAKPPDSRGGYVIRVSNPMTGLERLQLAAARLKGTPVAVMPHACVSVQEWLDRYADLRDN